MATLGRRLVFYSGGKVRVEEHEYPTPAAQQMLVRVARSQVSAGTEISGLKPLNRGTPRSRTGGYTAVGHVAEIGPAVPDFKLGDRVLCFGAHGSHVLADLSDPTSWRAHPSPVPDSVNDDQACFAVLGSYFAHGQIDRPTGRRKGRFRPA